ncbi:MAG: NAD(+)/NADH kinase [Oligoflexus sp.]
MNILLIRKPTNLEQHGDDIRRLLGHESKHIDQLTQAHEEHYRCLEVVRQQLANHDISYTEISRSENQPGEQFAAVITVGGDGTLLTASHYLDDHPLPVIGIRSSRASVGYLCAGDIDHVPQLVSQLAQGQLAYLLRQRLRAEIRRAEDDSLQKTFPVLNDFLFANSNPASTTRYRLEIAGQVEIQKSSGIWIATATGSTAAISAAGGQALATDDPRFQYAVRELYQGGEPFQLQKGFFDPEQDGFLIESHCARAILALDGERGLMRLKFGDQVKFRKAKPILIAKPIDR